MSRTTPTIDELVSQTVACPFCQSQPGEWCGDSDGGWASHIHVKRWNLTTELRTAIWFIQWRGLRDELVMIQDFPDKLDDEILKLNMIISMREEDHGRI